MTEPTAGWAAPGEEPGPPAATSGPVDAPTTYPPPAGPAYGPPVGPAYAAVQPWLAPSPVGGLGVALLAVGALYTVAKVAEAVLSFSLGDLVRPDGSTDPRLALTFAAETLVELVSILVLWVMASVWLMRVYRAAFAVAPGRMRRSIAWTWLGWFVPIVFFWFPKQIVDDVWRVAAAQPGRPERKRATGGWWAWWLIARIVDNASARAAPDAVAGLSVISAGLTVMAFVYWFRVVRGLSADHDAGPWARTDAASLSG